MKYIYPIIVSLFLTVNTLEAQITFTTADRTSYEQTISVSAEVQTSPAQVTLKWPAIYQQNLISNIIIYRRESTTAPWVQINSIAGSSLQYVDNTVSTNTRYEYKLNTEDYLQSGETHFHTEGVIEVCIECDAITSHGKVLLVVENSIKSGIQAELDTFKTDLIGSGWQVFETTVNSGDAVTSVKSTITNFYNNQNITSVVLIGQVPIPYSGLIYPDGHTDHRGAWPADVYYAEITGTNWTDATVNWNSTTIPSFRPWLVNTPGDGKFDPSSISSQPELEIGRIDFSGYTASSAADLDEVGMLKRYFSKNHKFRTSKLTHRRKVVSVDYFPTYGMAGTAYRDMATFFGMDSLEIIARENPRNDDSFIEATTAKTYLWGYGCGPGTGSSARGVATADDFFNNKSEVVFMSSFGSYFGDWNAGNNYLKAPLASQGDVLVNFWSGWARWKVHQMGTGRTIGYCTKVSQGAQDDVDYEIFGDREHISQFAFQTDRGVYMALMGDPTLTMLPVGKPTNMTLNEISPGIVRVNWTATDDASILGYNIYRANTINGTYSKLNATPVTGTEYTDFSPTFGNNVYFVKAIKLEETASGSYYNLSVGEYDSITASTALPTYALTVNDGSGSGNYPDAFSVSISANDSIFDRQFVAWTGDVSGVADVNAANTTITTGSSAATINATYTTIIVPVTDIDIDQSSLTLETGQSSTLTATITPSQVSNSDLTWSSENTAIATVNSSTGEVSGVAAGSVDIIVSADGGTDVKDTLEVTVILPSTEDTLNTIDDSFVRFNEDNDSSNYGSLNYIEVREAGIWGREGYLKFDLSSVTTTIRGLRLRLYVNSDPGGSSVTVSRIDDDSWLEGTIHGTNAPTTPSTTGPSMSITVNTWNEIDISSLLSGMGDNVLTLRLVGANNNFVRFDSKEGTNKPELIVEKQIVASASSSIVSTGLEEVSIYPNPTNTGSITVEGVLEGEDALVTILDASGHTVLVQDIYADDSTLELNIDELNEGFYLLYVQQGAAQVVAKFIKE